MKKVLLLFLLLPILAFSQNHIIKGKISGLDQTKMSISGFYGAEDLYGKVRVYFEFFGSKLVK